MSSDADSTGDLEELTRDELEERVRDLEEEVERLSDPEFMKALIRQVLDEDEGSAREEMEAAPLHIQRIGRLPDDVAEEELTENQNHARYLWNNFEEFSRPVRDGRVVKGGELRRILKARDGADAQVYTKTVGRVMNFVVTFTDEIASVQKSKDGERRLFVPNDWRRRAEERGKE